MTVSVSAVILNLVRLGLGGGRRRAAMLAVALTALAFATPPSCATHAVITAYSTDRPHRTTCTMSANINNAYFADCFAECTDAAALRKRYRGLAGVYHPDVPGGNAETFQRIASEYERRLEVLRASDPLDVEIQEALAELTEALSALAAQTLKSAVGSQTYSRMEDAARSSWRFLVGLSSTELLEASSSDQVTSDPADPARTPPNERKGLGRRAVSFIGNAFNRVRRGRNRQ